VDERCGLWWRLSLRQLQEVGSQGLTLDQLARVVDGPSSPTIIVSFSKNECGFVRLCAVLRCLMLFCAVLCSFVVHRMQFLSKKSSRWILRRSRSA